MNDFQHNGKGLLFNAFYNQKGNKYFYDLLKPLASEPILENELLDWGHKNKYERSIGVGECAGVAVDLGQIIQYEIDEKIDLASESLDQKQYADAIYHSYNVLLHSAKLLLLSLIHI